MSWALLGMVFLTACQKEDVDPNSGNNTNNNPVPSATALNQLFDQQRAAMKQSFTIDAAQGGTVVGMQGTKFRIPPSTFVDQAGNVVTGNVSIKIIEIYDRGSMVLANMPTMGKNSQGENALLISGGEYYFEATQNGSKLSVNQSIDVWMPTDNPSQEMDLFVATTNDQGNSVWDSAPIDSSNVVVTEDSTGMYYYSQYDGIYQGVEYNWINCDYFYGNSDPKMDLKVKLPAGSTGENSKLFIVIEGLNAIGELYDWDQDGIFEFNNIPIGLKVHLIALNVVDDVLYHKLLSITTTEGELVTIEEMEIMTQQELLNLINNLP